MSTESTSFTLDDEENSIRMVHHSKTPDLERELYREVDEKKRRAPSLLAGITRDVKDRWPTYISDWTDSWDYRVIPAVLETYINNLLPAIAFAQEMFTRTDNSFGVNEVLLSSAVGGIVFGALGGQPLCIVGVTGPISIFNSTMYDIIKPLGIDYFGFLFWVSMWAAAFHLILATTNAVCLLKYVSAFPCDIFELFINIVYVEKGIRLLIRQFSSTSREMLGSGYASIVVSLCMTLFGLIGKFITETPLFTLAIRTMISDYSTFLSVIFWSGFIHFGGYLDDVDFQKLPVSKAFTPTDAGRSSWMAYHPIPVKYIFLALPLGLLLTILFYFDHNVSSLMAQRHQYKLKKPSTFHYDFALLGITTGLSGLLGIPAPNGLIPQAPLHTKSLLVLGDDGEVIRCVEQRFTNTTQGLLMLGTMSGPLLKCLGQIPQAVLSSLFFIMGINGLSQSAIVRRTIWLASDPNKKDTTNPLNTIPTRTLLTFTAIGAFCAFVEFALTLSDAAIAFPVSLLITVLMSFLFPRFYEKDHLRILDEPVAEEFTLKNLSIDNIR